MNNLTIVLTMYNIFNIKYLPGTEASRPSSSSKFMLTAKFSSNMLNITKEITCLKWEI